MYKIVDKQELAENIFSFEIEAPRVTNNCLPGQFLIVKGDNFGERIPLTIADYDREKGTVVVCIQSVGESTHKLYKYQVGDSLQDVVGPLGKPSELCFENIESLKKKKILFVGGGLGSAPVYPQVKWLYEHGVDVDVIMGTRTKDLLFWEDKMRKVAKNLYITTDDGSYGIKGMVTKCITDLVKKEGKKYDLCVAIGPVIMMKFVCRTTEMLNIPTVVSMNTIMVDGTGMCGACRLLVDGKTKFACVDGPEFDGHLVDFDRALRRMKLYKTPQGRKQLKEEEGDEFESGRCETEAFNVLKRVPISEQDPKERAKNFDEVCLGYTLEEARLEASRCINCKNPFCVKGCPVSINIPGFIQALKEGDLNESFQILSQSTSLPAVCGRVCPQESQCEGKCVRGIKGDPVAIGKLERFVADWARENKVEAEVDQVEKKKEKVAIIGSGPSGIACASDLAKAGYQVTIFESLHLAGGVLQYGIPEFRLPKEKVVAYEVDSLRKLGVDIQTNVYVGRSVTIPELMEKEGFDAIYIASGAGLPRFMNIPGEHLNGVMSANEYLTRNNLMKAFDDSYDTNQTPGKNVITVGGGNVAMDAARTAVRLGAKSTIVYRRSQEELPARVEEVHHAMEEGVEFNLLSNPIAIHGDKDGWVSAVTCVQMELGEPDESGRRRPQVIPDSEFTIPCDTVIMALGTNSNPFFVEGTGVEQNKWKGIVIDEESGQTSVPGIFAGGDVVTGSATVILAMGAGRVAAKGIINYLENR